MLTDNLVTERLNLVVASILATADFGVGGAVLLLLEFATHFDGGLCGFRRL